MAELPDDELAKRRKAVQFAIDNTLLEGGVVTQETKALMDRWASGEISDEGLMAAVTRRFGGDEQAR